MFPPPINFDITHCAECGAAAYLRCNGCRDFLNIWYCNKICQAAHWKLHKLDCKSVQLYDRIRPLRWPTDVDQVKEAEDELNVNIDAITRQYLIYVPVQARPRTMDGTSCLNHDVMSAIKLLGETTTMREHSDRIKEHLEVLRNSFKDKYDYEVPFSIRPVIENGEGRLGIQLFVQDYETLSLKLFEDYFADGKKTTVDPWSSYMMTEEKKMET
ncbi:uncharacterized protein PV09_02701 [Verruconis gallopava]|uniref:MYND-type domain-containing protein n=1 Tax=Verruconis gallopava TaxID=253628 RepID=A0A0D2AHZ9_9PEZI|nr:uncharacterized protein PV09_02701 [Verruconis gallopava]KIW06225.1 hypothetical protein PV09_02701 [Verruconis gallopava]